MLGGIRVERGVERQSPEQAFLKIMKYIGEESVAMHSARFKAFTDLVDLQAVREQNEENEEYNRRDMMETIRKRKNGVPGYLSEYKRMNDMIDDYKAAMGAMPY